MPPSSDACDIFSNILASPVGVPQRNDSEIKLDLASIFQLPDDLLHIPGTSDDDLISVVLRDIQPSPFDNFTDDELSVYDCANSTFNIGSDEFDTMIAGGKEATISGWSTMLATNGIDANYEGDNGLLEFQSTKVAHTKPKVWANGTAAKQVDHLAHQVQSDLFHSMPPYIGEGHQCDLVGPSIQQLHGVRDVQQAPNHSSAEPHTRRSNRRTTNTRSPPRMSRKDMTTNESCVYHDPSAMPQHADAGSASPGSTSVDEKGNDVDDRRPSPTHEVICPRANPTSKRKTKSKKSNTPLRARSEDVTVNSLQIPPSPTQSSPVQSSPIQEYLRPIRGRPRRSKTGEQQSSAATPSTSATSDVLQPSNASAPTIPLSEMTEKARKTRKKPRKIIKPNPYPDLSRYPSQHGSDARTDNATTQDRPPSSNSTGSSTDIPLLPSTVFEFPLSISDESRSFVLTRAKWSQASRSSSTYAHGVEDSDSSFTTASVDNNGCRGFEFDDRPLDYPVSSSVAIQPPSLSLAWSTHSNDTVPNERKRKLAGDYSEETETGGSATRRIVDATGYLSSKLALYDQPVETLGPSFTHKTYGYGNPFTGIMQDYSLQMDSYRDVSARDGTLSSNDNDIGVWYDHHCLSTWRKPPPA